MGDGSNLAGTLNPLPLDGGNEMVPSETRQSPKATDTDIQRKFQTIVSLAWRFPRDCEIAPPSYRHRAAEKRGIRLV